MKNFIAFLFLVTFFCSSCESQTKTTIISKLPINISFENRADVRMGKKKISTLTVKDELADGFIVQIPLDIKLPNNSVLAFHKNLIGDSYFVIKRGDSNKNFKNNDKIAFVPKSQQPYKDSTSKHALK